MGFDSNQSSTNTSLNDEERAPSPQQLHSPEPIDTKENGSPNPRENRPSLSLGSLDASSKSITVAQGSSTFGEVNQHPGRRDSVVPPFLVGVSEDRNRKCRRTMEDCHCFIYDYAKVRGQGFFAIFDGHAGKHAAEYCGSNFHKYLLDQFEQSPQLTVPDALNNTFQAVDHKLSEISKQANTHSGCTAVTAFLRLENKLGEAITPEQLDSDPSIEIRRTLYTGNVGDARAVLARNGQAVRLTYDHKGSDVHEAKRITDAGGFMMNNRVNGVLAVTRSLGDSTMKDFVVGAPYTTETTLSENDDWLIVACDGLWDVCEDQDAVDLIKNLTDPQEASQTLLDVALKRYSTDNLSVIVVSLQPWKLDQLKSTSASTTTIHSSSSLKTSTIDQNDQDTSS